MILSALLQKKSNNTAKIILTDNFTKPVADATGYKNITPVGVLGYEQVITWLKNITGKARFSSSGNSLELLPTIHLIRLRGICNAGYTFQG
ncbi:MAG: hypothetical protein GYB55_24910 [Cytophagales bacterium]|nr:hypothetical protein [Cytophagales bacterium]